MDRLNLNALRTITPSQHNPWAQYHVGKLSPAQQRKAAAMGGKLVRNRARMCLPETFTVRLELERATLSEPVRYAEILCPVLACNRDRTRILVIAPDGTDQWVDWKGQR